MRSLRMNYAQLDSHLKPCFAYCSIFPQNFQFEEEWLIQLWEAQVFIPRFPNIAEMMAAGSNYFRSFVQLSFFQRVHFGHIRERDLYSIPQKMQELALHVSAGDCYILGSDRPCDSPKKVRHLTVQFDKLANVNRLDEISNYTSLYTLLIVGGPANYPPSILNDVLQNTLQTVQRLRVLDVSNFGLSELPESIGDLIHLRCLQLRGTKIRRLPESVCHLYHLQTLGLRNCYYLEELPTDIKYLGKLRHIDLHLDNHQPTQLKHMPEGIGSLIGLHTLSRFVISTRRGRHRHSSVHELSKLINLSGALLISNLDIVKDAQEAQQADLASKKLLRKLELSWCENTNKQLDEDTIIENLKPANTLNELTVSGYGGLACPSWLCSENYMHDLVTVRLHGFKSCDALPSLGLLPQLKNLYLTSWDQLKFINSSSYVYGHGASFLSLKKFHLEGMHSLQRWEWDELCTFAPGLRELVVKNCPQLRELPRCIQNLRDLEDMEIVGCWELALLPHLNGLTSLQRLEISDCNSICSLPCTGLPRSLQVLSINNCHQLSHSCKNLRSIISSVWIDGHRI
ncbi:hypothetical protein BDA96_01G213100 [Sorghum bicolor]|nr:hypothetical protein BDA96_01G213100 [Sorghum bicolor]